MSIEKNVPEIRFKGFSGEWEEQTLGEIGSLKNGMNFDKSAMGHGHPFVNLQDVFGKNEVSGKNLGLAYSTENQRKDYCLNEGDVLFIRSSVKPDGVGEAAVVPQHMANTTYSGFIIRFRPNLEMDVNFNRFVYSTANSRKQILASSTSSANSNINQDSLQRIQLALPCKQEQTAIGNTFQKLDSLISQHQQKQDKLSNIKKAMLEKMFPKQGETTPEIRFKGFCGEWEVKTLGDYAIFRRGSFPQPYGNREWYGGEGSMPFVQVVDVGKDLSLADDTKQKISLKAQPLSVFVPKGSVVVTLQGTIGRVAITQYDSFFDRTILIFQSFSKNTDSSFWAYTIQNKFDLEKKRAPGGTIKTITKDVLFSFEVLIPPFEEQEVIGNYFQKLDVLINQHQQQITKLNNIKQACLSKMFV